MITSRSEESRLAALRAAELMDTATEPVFDRLTTLVSRALAVPVALISLVDDRRQFFKSQIGLPSPYGETRETPLTHSFCQHVAHSSEPLIIEDARGHPLVGDNLAIRDLNVVAYAGVPLLDSQGHCLGSLCAIDVKPRQWSNEDIELLNTLAAYTMAEIETRNRERLLHTHLLEMKRVEAERRATHRHTIHDLRTPLNSLLLNLEVLTTLELSAEQSEWTGMTQRSALELKHLVDDLVDHEVVAQKGSDALTLGEFAPELLAEAALNQVKGSAHSGKLLLTTDFAEGLPKIQVDDRKIVRVLVNLLGNAIKFTPSSGQIRLAIKARDDNQVEFAVSDTGIGFNQAQAEEIFQPGVMLDRHASSNKSTGWGLEFCRRVVDAHQGKIEVASAVGQGSTFTVVLPIISRIESA